MEMFIWNILDKNGFSKKFQMNLKSKMHNFSTFLSSGNYILSGSFAEGVTGSFNYSDIDIMFVQQVEASHDLNGSNPNLKLQVEIDNMYPGYCFLQSKTRCIYNTNYRSNVLFSPMTYHIPVFICEKTNDRWMMANDTIKDMYKHELERDTNGYSRFHQQGPSVAENTDDFGDSLRELLNYMGINDIKHFEGFDNVLAIKCVRWPSAADEWLLRQRYFCWPRVTIIDHYKRNGCLLVPVGKKGSKTERFEWRFSFSEVELDLVHSFNDNQIKCYVILKFLLKSVIKDQIGNVLSSYVMKTCMFWEIEESVPEKWLAPRNLLHCVASCIRRILKWLEQNHFPNYFIKHQNLLDGKFEPNHGEHYINASEKRNDLKQCLLDVLDNLSTRITNIPVFLNHIRSDNIFAPLMAFVLPLYFLCSFKATNNGKTLDQRFLISEHRILIENLDVQENKAHDLPIKVKFRSHWYFMFVLYLLLKFLCADVSSTTAHLANNRTKYAKLKKVRCFYKHFADVSDIYKDVMMAQMFFVLSEFETVVKITDRVIRHMTDKNYFFRRGCSFHSFVLSWWGSNEVNLSHIPNITFSKVEFPNLPKILQYEVVCNNIAQAKTISVDKIRIEPLLHAHLLRFLALHQLDRNVPQLQAIKGLEAFYKICSSSNNQKAITGNILGHCLHKVREPRQAFKILCRTFALKNKSKATIWNIAILLNKEIWNDLNRER